MQVIYRVRKDSPDGLFAKYRNRIISIAYIKVISLHIMKMALMKMNLMIGVTIYG